MTSTNTDLTPAARKGRAVETSQPRRVRPPVDIFESDADFMIRADLPGVLDEGVEIHIHEGELRIEATQAEQGPEGFTPMRFARAFRVPDFIDSQSIAARLDAGVLHLTLPKKQAARPRKIAVRTA